MSNNLRSTADRLVRDILRRALRGRKFRRKPPPAFGSRPVYVVSDSALQFLLKARFGDIGEGLMALADQFVRPADNVWDIGANIGIFTVAAAHRSATGAIMALEPDLTLVNLLRQTTSLPENLDLDIQVVPAAVSNRSGIAVLEFSNNGRAGNRLSDAFAVDIPSALQATATVAVPSLTLGSLLDYPSAHNMPQFIKIDVEGAEHLVLSGGAQVLAKARPIFAIEVWKENSVFVSELLRDNGYAVFDGTNLRIGLREVHACPYDTIAIPRERVAEETALAKARFEQTQSA